MRRRRPTIRDVARQADVSIATVSRVLNESAPVEDDTAARVRHAVADLAYRPAVAAQVLARRRTNAIGLVLSRITGDFFAPLLRGIEAEASDAGLSLLISTGGRDGGAALAEHNTDGVLVFAGSLSDAEVRALAAVDHPTVLLHRTPPPGLAIPCVTVENKSGARQLVDHLVEVHGCRRIAFLRGPEGHEDSDWRELGLRESLASHALSSEDAIVGRGNFRADDAEAEVERWLERGIVPDAIFAGDDAAAVGVVRAIARHAPRGGIAVVGFDDVPLARHLSPPLTTVRAPTERIGREAVRQLLLAMRQAPVDPLVLLPTDLVVRESCGCRPGTGAGR